ncbi:carbamoyltransferase HypF, partial [bacterium]|nr:carbamoyltransferase HypF [bacterium]
MVRLQRDDLLEAAEPTERLRVIIKGAVQGVGFRPFVHRLAQELRLTGLVKNSTQGVLIEVEGERGLLDEFLLRLDVDKPPHSYIQSRESVFLDVKGYNAFEILASDSEGDKYALVLPDIATCPECILEIFDPTNRRYLYSFTNCTHCGPRYSIIENLPYDRASTTMKHFQMCDRCKSEYENPNDRRFHAQPNACPDCGPHLELCDENGGYLSARYDALLDAAAAIRQGKIVALKGLGGFQLIVDARNEDAVARLRLRKRREEKPFALMSPELADIEDHCEVSPAEKRLLLSAESPIVLLKRIEGIDSVLALSVSPRNPYLGFMLPYSPLHHMLMQELKFPVVATSGNLSDDPICTDEEEAVLRLAGIADLFLVHNRPIARHVDDSVVRVILGRELMLRRARGYAPLPVSMKQSLKNTLAMGGHLKNTVAISIKSNVFISQHIGDLETAQACEAFSETVESLTKIYDFKPDCVVCDLHPDYHSTRFARKMGVPFVQVQHHYAHVLSCMAENEIEAPVLGVAWDGTGYGLDGSVWGGEFLLVKSRSFKRIAYFKNFPLPGGEAAVREPRRAALGVLYEMFGNGLFSKRELKPLMAFDDRELDNLKIMLSKGLNSPVTSSAGRLFDALASILGIRQINRFEGQAAMELEFLTDGTHIDESYPVIFHEKETGPFIDWKFIFREILIDLEGGLPAADISAKFHNTLAECIVRVALHVGENKVVLSGGCFQNKYL